MLEVRNLSVSYGQHPALKDVSLRVSPGEIVVILGANGAGKSTLLRAVSGICEGHVAGEITLDGVEITRLSSNRIVDKGVALVPEGRGIFGDLTVRENLLLGAYSERARHDEASNLERVWQLFPKLGERQTQIAHTMSGGEQQMVAIGRAMMSAPQILMLDEPSLGLSPLLCKELFQNLAKVREMGIGVLLVEQNAKQSLAIADRGYLLENTRITHEDSADRLAVDPAVQKAYLGAGGSATAVVSTTDKPKPAEPERRPAPVAARRSAAPQIDIDIDGLVSAATLVSAQRPAGRSAVKPADVDRVVSSRLAPVLKDIERAAAEARSRPSRVSRVPASTPREPDSAHENAAAPPPVIEVYRRPRVEVYRRQPTGDFERSQGE